MWNLNCHSANVLIAVLLSSLLLSSCIFMFSKRKILVSLYSMINFLVQKKSSLLTYKVGLVTKEACLTRENFEKGGIQLCSKCYLSPLSNSKSGIPCQMKRFHRYDKETSTIILNGQKCALRFFIINQGSTNQ